jgi:hypothetical protein
MEHHELCDRKFPSLCNACIVQELRSFSTNQAQSLAQPVPVNNLLSSVRELALNGMSHGLLADEYCSQIVALIDANGKLS